MMNRSKPEFKTIGKEEKQKDRIIGLSNRYTKFSKD
jgi:hypothetical protein